MSKFDYESCALPSAVTHIRILELRLSGSATPPGATALPPSGTFICKLSTTSIEAPQPYKALSYTWGIEGKTSFLDISGTQLNITPSLYTALRYIASWQDVIYLWVDQVCIDQNNNTEKADQVLLMADVYSKAEQTLVWLGPAADRSDELMDLWLYVGRQAEAMGLESYFTKEKIHRLFAVMDNRYVDDSLAEPYHQLVDETRPRFEDLMQAMVDLDQRPWFHRVWIVQEVSLCPDTLFVESETRATQNRDRIYGLLGLAVDAEQLKIKPDYTCSKVGPIFANAARAMIQKGRVELLSFSQFPKEDDIERLPTWAPDWRPNLASSFYTIFESAEDHLMSASGSTRVSLLPTTDENVLGIRGYLVDSIEEVGTVWHTSDDHASYLLLFKTIQDFCVKSAAKDEPIYKDPLRRAEATWRVPVGDLYWTPELDNVRATKALVENRYHDCVRLSEVIAGGEEVLTREEVHRLLAGRYRSNMSGMDGKRPYITRKGYLGMCPGSALPGDVVVIFHGARLPYVLRPRPEGDRYTFLGEAYCDGMMDGEISEGRQETSFFIE
ncbi:HET-domain-containing protein [Karstenula rhodostoma CBS 690.94]|uniref:HET-domain-containing protein n=1 Tax=Karstenula rhodostoma CBS 690.94 TaxID=1392251 RepID=A0A9P4U9B7_9PLEO|nr:HET-domain-containing protein [Karstenula rhodostoma CBS 690.94]